MINYFKELLKKLLKRLYCQDIKKMHISNNIRYYLHNGPYITLYNP